MKDIILQLKPWIEIKKPFALATVLKTWGSAPRKTGAHMAIHKDGSILGSVSGGCVEGDVGKAAQEVISSGKSKILHYGVSHESAWSVGLSCGGKIDVFVEPCFSGETNSADQSFWGEILAAINGNKGGVILRKVDESVPERSFIHINSPDFENHVDVKKAYSERRHFISEQSNGNYFYEVIPPKSRLLIIGAAHVTADLVHLAKDFGFETVVIDPRSFFTDNTAFVSNPDTIHQDWPAEVLQKYPLDAYTYAVTLTHDPKIDDQALKVILRSGIAYIGALGSRKTHEKRCRRLLSAGFSETEIKKIHAPVGAKINAQSAREIALSIMAEIIQVKNKYHV